MIVIAGPTATGKTTLSQMLSEHYNCAHISEDDVAREIFPDTYKNMEDFPDKVKIVKRQLLKRAKYIFRCGESVVIDRINLGKEFIEEIKKAFGRHLTLKVIWPSVETTIVEIKLDNYQIYLSAPERFAIELCSYISIFPLSQVPCTLHHRWKRHGLRCINWEQIKYG